MTFRVNSDIYNDYCSNLFIDLPMYNPNGKKTAEIKQSQNSKYNSSRHTQQISRLVP